jgi:hypothetical protein
VTVVSLPARGRPPQAAARRVGLEFVEKLLTRTSPARTRRSGTPACFARPASAPTRRSTRLLVVLDYSCCAWSHCKAGVGLAKARRPTLRGGLHAAGEAAAGVARVANPVVVVSSGARACPLGIRCQQRVGPWSSATSPGPNTTHERTEPTEHLSSCRHDAFQWIVALTPGAVKRSLGDLRHLRLVTSITGSWPGGRRR